MKKITALGLLLSLGIIAFGQHSLPSLALQPLALPIGFNMPALGLPAMKMIPVPPHANHSVTRVDDACASACPIILPLSALELQGLRLNDYQVALNWKTKNEQDSRGFDIERSLGDQMHFIVVGSTASNTSIAVEKKYASTDPNTFSGISFYRVKQIDLDGKFAYSNTVQVKGYNTKESVWLLPNPASTVAVLYCYTATTGNYTIKILAANGQTVFTQKTNMAVGSNSVKLPVQNMPSGMYYVQLIWPDGHRQDLKMAKE